MSSDAEVGEAMPHACERMAASVSERALIYADKFREYGVAVPDGGSSKIVLCYCPFCGQRLPKPLRNAWFDELTKLDLEPDGALPEILRTGAWWRAQQIP